MSVVRGTNATDPAEAIIRAIHIATSATLLKRPAEWNYEIHADQAESLRLISAFAQIEAADIRQMLVQVTEVLAETGRSAAEA